MDYLRRWKNLGGGLILAESLIQAREIKIFGLTGLLESTIQDSSQAHKYQAFVSFIKGG